MEKITVKWLKKKKACISLEEMQEAEKIGDVFEILKELIKRKRFRDTNWLLSKYMKINQCRKYAIFAAKLVLPIFEKEFPDDNRPRAAIEMAEKCLKKPTQKNEIAAVTADADAAADAAYAYADANAAANAAVNAAYTIANAALDDADAAAYAAAYAALDAADAVSKTKVLLKIINYGIKLLKENKE